MDEEETPSRTLADILREAGIDSAGRGGRRRAAGDGTDLDPTAHPDAHPAPARERLPSQSEPEPTGPAAAPRRRGRTLGVVWLVLELVLAAVAGVVVYYAFGLFWELYPYLGVAAAAVVLAGLGSAAQWFRLRRDGGVLTPLALGAVLVVGAVLTLLPAADVLTR